MGLIEVRRAIGRMKRNRLRNHLVGVGHEFLSDVRSRLPHVPIETIFDVGAHIGMTALDFSDEWPQAQVWAFEPHPGNFSRLKSNLVGKPAAKLFQLGFSDKRGELAFHFDPEHPSMARIVAHGESVTDTVNLDRLDRFSDANGVQQIDLLKIDVEGHEMPVLFGAEELLAESRINIIRIETSIDPDTPYHTQLFDICDYLHPYGYRLFGFYDQWEYPLIDSPQLRRFDVAFISRRAQERLPPKEMRTGK